MTRFFVSPEEMGESFLVLTGENAAHAKVLRLKAGDMVTVCDGQGRECNCTVSDVSPGQVSLVAHHWGNSQGEAVVPVRIFMAFPKADKLEHVIQKATELGATEIITFPTARCVSRPEERALEKSWTGGGKLRLRRRSSPAGDGFPGSRCCPATPPPWRRRPRRSCPSCFMK